MLGRPEVNRGCVAPLYFDPGMIIPPRPGRDFSCFNLMGQGTAQSLAAVS
ncbi:MAG: hypothetical protein PWR07_2044 [Bacillota bacterium]|nr:hypothetical protein [Bacillota bacterium]